MIKANFFTLRLLSGLCLFWLLIFIAYQCDKNARMDDDYIGEQVFWLMKEGKVKSELMGGYNNIGLENYQSVFHKLWVYNGFAFCTLFGWSITTLHWASIFYFILFIPIFYLYLKKNFPEHRPIFLFALLIILAHHEIKNIVWSFRPEVMVMCLGFISFTFLDGFLRQNRPYKLVFAAIFAGAAFLTHLNGLIYVSAGVILLLLHQRWIACFLFGAISASVFSIYFIDILLNADLAYFWHQFRNDPSLVKSNFSFLGFLERIAMEQARYLFSEKEIPLTILLVLSFFFLRKTSNGQYKNLLIYTLILMATMAVWSYTKVPYLLILHLPFFSIIIGIFLKNLFLSKNLIVPNWANRLVIFCIIAFLSIDLVYASQKIAENFKNFSQLSTRENNQKLSKIIEQHSQIPLKELKILSFGSFIFEEIYNYKSIKNIEQYIFFREYHQNPPMSFADVAQIASLEKISFVLLTDIQAEYFKLKSKATEYPKELLLIYQDDNFWIFKLT